MKHIIQIFVLSWAVFCLIMTGATVLQPGVFNDPAIDPARAQDEAGSIYNQGARAAYRQHLVHDKQATFIDAHNSLENLSVRYWLYPSELIGSRYGTDLTLTLQHPEKHTIIYVGSRQAYEDALRPVQSRFGSTIVTTKGSDVFAILTQL